MNRLGLLEHELLMYFTSALGCRAQSMDNCGLNTPSPDREAHVTDAWIGDVSRHRRVRAVLARIPGTYAILATAYAPRRPLPQQIVHLLGGNEYVARLVPESWSLRTAFEDQSSVAEYETYVVHVARDKEHKALRERAVEEANLLLSQALDAYAVARRSSREAA